MVAHARHQTFAGIRALPSLIVFHFSRALATPNTVRYAVIALARKWIDVIFAVTHLNPSFLDVEQLEKGFDVRASNAPITHATSTIAVSAILWALSDFSYLRHAFAFPLFSECHARFGCRNNIPAPEERLVNLLMKIRLLVVRAWVWGAS
jgi:hypothetical protein